MDYIAPFGSSDPDAPYVDRDTPGAVSGSKVPAHAIEYPMRELVNLISAADLDPDNADLTQVAKAIQSGALNYAVVAGTVNALTLTLNPVPDALTQGFPILFVAAGSNTGNVTVNPNGLGAKSLFGPAGQQLAAGDLFSGLIVLAVYNGVSFRIIGSLTASEAAKGIVELASAAETAAGTDLTRPAAVGRMAAQVQSGSWNYAVAAGSANALTATFIPTPAALPDGMEIALLISTTNTGAATLNVNSISADAIQNNNGGALIGGELVAGNTAQLIRRSGAWRLTGVSKGRLIATQVFKTAGTSTYTPTPGTLYVEVEVQGGGGAGGGTPATSTNQLSIAGGGGSGAWAQKLITSGFAGVTVTVGAGGVGNSGAAGGNGGASSFGALVSANGGNGGGSSGPGGNTQNFNTSGGAGGIVGSSGDINSAGVTGLGLLMVSATGTQGIVTPSRFAGGPGAGGQGSSSPANTAAAAGPNGQPGIVIVREYA
jgi:hypothetical protein